MIIIVALTFILSWSPFYIVSLVSQVQQNSFLRRSNFLFTMLATHLSGFINSSINPIVYHAMSDRFRRSFLDIWCRIVTVLCCGSNRCMPVRNRNHGISMNGRCETSRTYSGTCTTTGESVVTTYCTSMAMEERDKDASSSYKKGPYSALTANDNGQGNSYL